MASIMSGRKVTGEVETEICRLYVEERLGTGQIGRRLHLSRTMVVRVLDRNGVGRDRSRTGLAVASAQTRQAVASLGGQSVPSANRMFSRDRELAVSSGRQSQMTDRDED
ncbi:hypothetical protein [Salinarimonas soli]|uniref:hypothetical protein n=1 Tax=Salinarimonas soli TaxID=1638099 RepID=UPI001F0B70D6|nr:hypothetical protein [Salinarimonas soli]